MTWTSSIRGYRKPLQMLEVVGKAPGADSSGALPQLCLLIIQRGCHSGHERTGLATRKPKANLQVEAHLREEIGKNKTGKEGEGDITAYPQSSMRY